jgi:flavin reductase (DIM6/NTAB) family NADH-FMN oxidoreductase RutF
VAQELQAGDHHLIIGKVIAGDLRNPKGLPLLYAHTENLDGAIALFPEQLSN